MFPALPAIHQESQAACERYLHLLLEANKTLNLTAITDPQEAWRRHILESLALAPRIAHESRTVDIGSGGGLPGIPLAIACPDAHFTLLEATGKKTRFLEQVIERLNLRNAAVLNARAEEAGHNPAHRAGFDIATCRAVGSLSELLELALPLLRIPGVLLAVKGERAKAEIDQAARALHLLGGAMEECAPLFPDKTGEPACLLVIQKVRETPPTYPRRPGIPKKNPLA